MHRWVVVGAVFGALAAAAITDCTSTDSSTAADGGCVPAEGGVASYVANVVAASCNSCLEATCNGALYACGNDCSCSAQAMAALTCTGDLGGDASTAFQTSCLAPLTSATDPTTQSIGACIQECAGACGGVAPAGACEGDAGLTTHFGSEESDCESCVAASCNDLVLTCEDDCSCSATADTALDCLDALGGDASVATLNGCLKPLASSGNDGGQLDLATCIVQSCTPSCGAPPDDGGGEDAASDDAGGDDAGDAANDAGVDAGSGDASDGATPDGPLDSGSD